MNLIANFNYTDKESVGTSSKIDLALGFVGHQVGRTNAIANLPCFAIVKNNHGKGYVAWVTTELDQSESCWKEAGDARDWGHIYRATPVTGIVDVPPISQQTSLDIRAKIFNEMMASIQ